MSTVKEAIMWCYDILNSEIFTSIDAANLLIFAHEYEINDLKKCMEIFFCENLSTANASLFANSSITPKADKLYQKCFDLLFACMKLGTAVKEIEMINPEMKDALFFKCFYAVM